MIAKLKNNLKNNNNNIRHASWKFHVLFLVNLARSRYFWLTGDVLAFRVI